MFLKNMENAHSNIDSLLDMDFLRTKLAELSGLQDTYQFGDQNRGIFTNNIIDALVDSQLKDGNMEDLLKLCIGGTFGQDNQWSSMLEGGKGWGNFNLSRSF